LFRPEKSQRRHGGESISIAVVDHHGSVFVDVDSADLCVPALKEAKGLSCYSHTSFFLGSHHLEEGFSFIDQGIEDGARVSLQVTPHLSCRQCCCNDWINLISAFLQTDGNTFGPIPYEGRCLNGHSGDSMGTYKAWLTFDLTPHEPHNLGRCTGRRQHFAVRNGQRTPQTDYDNEEWYHWDPVTGRVGRGGDSWKGQGPTTVMLEQLGDFTAHKDLSLDLKNRWGNIIEFWASAQVPDSNPNSITLTRTQTPDGPGSPRDAYGVSPHPRSGGDPGQARPRHRARRELLR
jgi:hypothetical protein